MEKIRNKVKTANQIVGIVRTHPNLKMLLNPPGPSKPSLWLTRPLGYWEKQMLMEVPDDSEGPKCTLNNVTHIDTDQEINVAKFEQAVKATVYNEPHLRADVNLKTESWVPATNFNELFSFKDLTENGYKTVGDIWPMVLADGSRPWE